MVEGCCAVFVDTVVTWKVRRHKRCQKQKILFLVADQTQILPLLNMKHMKVIDADPTVAVGSTAHLFLSSVQLDLTS